MTHVILGWGSLLWDQGASPLPLRTEWHSEGPSLPLEFSRVSTTRQGALTLVVDPKNGADCSTSFAVSSRELLEDAIRDLRCREGTISKRIGFVDLVSGTQRSNVHPALADLVRSWAEERGFSSAVWTDLPSNFDEDHRGPFSVEAAEQHLRSLGADGQRCAKEYIYRAPACVRTPLRDHVEGAEWWATYDAT